MGGRWLAPLVFGAAVGGTLVAVLADVEGGITAEIVVSGVFAAMLLVVIVRREDRALAQVWPRISGKIIVLVFGGSAATYLVSAAVEGSLVQAVLAVEYALMAASIPIAAHRWASRHPEDDLATPESPITSR